MFEQNIRYFSFDHIAHRRAGRSSVLEPSCTKRLGLRSGPAYQWRTLYGFNVFENNIRYALVRPDLCPNVWQEHSSINALVSKCLDADQAQGFVGPDMGPNQFLKRIAADGPSYFHSTGIDQLSCRRAPNSLDQARLFVSPDMVSKCLVILFSAVRPSWPESRPGPTFCWVFCYCSQNSFKYS